MRLAAQGVPPSQIARRLSLAAIGVVWVFEVTQDDQTIQLPRILVGTIALVVLGLVFDLMQYLYSSAALSILNRIKEKKLGAGPGAEYDAPPWINWANIFFFWAKMAMVLAAYGSLAVFLVRKLAIAR